MRGVGGRRVWSLVGIAVLSVLAMAGFCSRRIDVRGEVWIAGTPAAVWGVLTDEAAYPAWNPMIRRMTGALVEGRRIEITEGTGPDTMRFRPMVLRVWPGRELLWHGFLYAPGLVDVHHSFRMVAENGGTRVVQSEVYTGLLVNRWTAGEIRETQGPLEDLNEALKRRVEGMR